MITLLAFIVTLATLIVIHEYGHYRVAVACGVKVLRFSVGFGRVVWRHVRGETEFVICALPLGGYVRMLDEREGEVPAHEAHRAFNRQSLWRRSAIVSAGPLANLALAIVLYAGAHWIGVDEPKAVLGSPAPASLAERAGLRSGDWVRSYAANDGDWVELDSLSDLRWQVTQRVLSGQPLTLSVTDARGRNPRQLTLELQQLQSREVDAALARRIGLGGPYSEPVMGDVKADGAAAQAGLRKGDRVLRVDGMAVADATELRERIRESAADGIGRAMVWSIERAGQTLDVSVRPRATTDGKRSVGRIEAYVGAPPELVKVRHGPVDGLVKGAQRTWDVSALTIKMLGRMLIGEASVRNLSGPLTIADYAGQSVQQGLAYYLGFLALVSVSLGVLNLLPLPMLDGGHLMYYLFEAATGRPVSDLWLARLQRGGVAILLLMMSVALYNDVARLLGLH